jgi:UDP-GlcNAc:undecaprenyl-phosphate/decaprenyl-phosphate GlcNAc-1-phosphate transferase
MTLISMAMLTVMAAAYSYWLGQNAEHIGGRLRIMDVPDPLGGRKRHKQITPLVGGIASIPPALVVLLMGVWVYTDHMMVATTLTILFVATASLLLLGLLDDRYEVSPLLRLLATLLIFGYAILSAPDFQIHQLMFSGVDHIAELGAFSGIFTLACLTGLLNAINMADGKNGLVIGLSLVWLSFFAVYAPSWLNAPLAAAAASLVVTLIYNAKGRLFLGDTGSYGLSAFLGLTAILLYNLRPDVLMAEQVALWFMIPVLDCLRLMMVRAARGVSPFDGDRDHLHHHIASWMPWRYGIWIYLALVAIPGAVSIAWPSATFACIIVSAIAYAAVLAFTALDKNRASVI